MIFVNLFYKYAPLLYILFIFLMQVHLFGNTVLYTFMMLSALLMLPYLLMNPKVYIKQYFSLFLVINILNLIYLISFNHTIDSIMYVGAKFILFSIIIISIYKYKYFYLNSYTKLLSYLLLAILVIGAMIHPPGEGRYAGLLGNPNSLGIVATLSFGLIYLKEKLTRTDKLLIIFVLLLVLLSGSRNALLGVFLAYLLKGSFSIKGIIRIVFGALFFVGIYFSIATGSGGSTGIDRIINPAQEDSILSGRDMEFLLGYKTVLLSPWIGNGVDKIDYIAEEVVPPYLLKHGFVLNPHNSVIGLWNQYGIPIGTLLFLWIVYYVYKIYAWKEKDKSLFFIIGYLLIASLFESILSSINAFESMIFWSAFAVNMVAYSMRKK